MDDERAFEIGHGIRAVLNGKRIIVKIQDMEFTLYSEG